MYIQNFDTPTQVRFHDIEYPDVHCYGIGFNDVLICACCGGVYPIEEQGETFVVDEIDEDFWVDFSGALHDD